MRASVIHKEVYDDLFKEALGSQVVVTHAWNSAMKKAVSEGRTFSREDVKTEIRKVLAERASRKQVRQPA